MPDIALDTKHTIVKAGEIYLLNIWRWMFHTQTYINCGKIKFLVEISLWSSA